MSAIVPPSSLHCSFLTAGFTGASYMPKILVALAGQSFVTKYSFREASHSLSLWLRKLFFRQLLGSVKLAGYWSYCFQGKSLFLSPYPAAPPCVLSQLYWFNTECKTERKILLNVPNRLSTVFFNLKQSYISIRLL